VRVTILTPTLDAERYFPECLASLSRQTYPRDRIQHLVLDGGSADRTVSLARQAGAEVSVARDGSLYEAMNRGVALATGEVVGWLNADDTFKPDAVERAVEAFEAHPRAEIAVGDYEMAFPGRTLVVRVRADALSRIRAGKASGTWVTPLAVFFRTETLRGLGPYRTDLRVASDLDLWIRAAARTPPPEVVHTGGVAGTFREHEDSLSSGTKRERSIREALEIAGRWRLDERAPPGVRRHALALVRQNEFVLSAWQAREGSSGARLRACMREVWRLGPRALWDIREQLRYEVDAIRSQRRAEP